MYDAVEGDYINMLCNIGYDSNKVRNIAGGGSSCLEDIKRTAKDLNYPSMVAYIYGNKSFNITLKRTVTNVGFWKSTYKVKISKEPRIKIYVNPKVLSFYSLGEKKSFVVSVVVEDCQHDPLYHHYVGLIDLM